MSPIKFSLVTTCRNEMRSLRRWKENILAQTRPPDEIVVVDAFSDDGTAENLFKWRAEDKRLVVIQEKGAAAHGRNVAIEHAKYEHILSTDMGIRLAPVWCEELIKPFESDPTVEVVAGNTQIDQETLKTAVARAAYYVANGGLSKLETGFVIGNRSSAYLKRVWRELGGLPEDLTFYADDSVFGRQILQAGYKMAFAPKAMTYWARHTRLKDYWKETRGYGIGDGEAYIKTPAAFRLYRKKLLPAFMVPPLTAFRLFARQIPRISYWLVLKKMDLIALAYIPPLILGNGWHFAKGYLLGYKRGETACRSCRSRIAHNPQEDKSV